MLLEIVRKRVRVTVVPNHQFNIYLKRVEKYCKEEGLCHRYFDVIVFFFLVFGIRSYPDINYMC